MTKSDTAALVGVGSAFLIGLAFIGAWLTHIIVCLKTASWGFLIAGAVFAPIGIVHGIGLWFGFF